jgi:monoamine oxidase
VTFSRPAGVDCEQFDYVVLATPPTVWPRIDSSPPFRPQDYSMQQGPAIKFLSTFDREFWKSDRLAPKALSDTIGSVWESTDKQPASKKGFGLAVYSGGTYVLDDATYQARLTAELYPKYPANLKRHQLVDWPNQPWIMTGYSIPGPGQVTTVAKNLRTPYLGRLFFAGEQASPGFFGFMEGALQSGVLASEQIVYAVARSGWRVPPGSRSACTCEKEMRVA